MPQVVVKDIKVRQVHGNVTQLRAARDTKYQATRPSPPLPSSQVSNHPSFMMIVAIIPSYHYPTIIKSAYLDIMHAKGTPKATPAADEGGKGFAAGAITATTTMEFGTTTAGSDIDGGQGNEGGDASHRMSNATNHEGGEGACSGRSERRQNVETATTIMNRYVMCKSVGRQCRSKNQLTDCLCMNKWMGPGVSHHTWGIHTLHRPLRPTLSLPLSQTFAMDRSVVLLSPPPPSHPHPPPLGFPSPCERIVSA